MYLQEVTLRNWRSYRSAGFRFPAPTKNKKVVLVGAMNGNGKTSLLMGLYLGLFGREAMPFLEGVRLGSTEDDKIRSYRQLMQHMLHRQSLDQEDPSATIELVFAGSKGGAIRITRTWHYTRGGHPRDLSNGDGEEVRIEEGGRLVKTAGWEDANNRIADLLFPPHIMPCFFFDGEQAQERVEAAGGRALMDAINTLFGTTLLRQLGESLTSYVSNKRSQLKQNIGDIREDELSRKRTRRDEMEQQLDRTGGELRKVQTDLDQAEKARKEKTIEMTQLAGDAAIDVQQLSQRKNDLEKREQDLRTKLCEDLARLALPMTIKRLGDSVSEQLDAEIIRDRWLILRDEAISKADKIVAQSIPSPKDKWLDPALTEDQRGTLQDRLRKALEMLWSPPPKGCADDFKYPFMGSSDRTSTLQRLCVLMGEQAPDVGKVAAEWNESRIRLRDIQTKWDNIRDLAPRLQEIKNRVSELDARVREFWTAKANFEANERGLRTELKDLSAAIGQMEQAKRKMGPAEVRLDLAERVREVLRDAEPKLVPLCKKALEDACTRHFKEMISGEYHNHKVEFDNEFQPRLVAADSSPIYVTTMSGGQKRAFGLAFTLAVAQATNEDAPIVIDTPVGNMDSEYRKRVLRYLAEASPGQLIFLSHDEEISREYAAEISSFVGERFLVDFEQIADGVGISTPRQGTYFTT